MRLVVGLGNPGERYARTRHNVAWRVLDTLAQRHQAVAGEATPTSRTRQLWLGDHEVVLMEPLTFMNLSGEALAQWRGQHEVSDDEFLVITDDVYLPLGTLRLRARGSSGGHRGLDSIEATLGHRDYARLRFGVDAAESSAELKSHVLEEFAPAEEPVLQAAVRLAADAVECWVSEGLLAAMNQFNRRVRMEDSET